MINKIKQETNDVPFFVFDKETKIFSIRKVAFNRTNLLLEPVDKNIQMINFIEKEMLKIGQEKINYIF